MFAIEGNTRLFDSIPLIRPLPTNLFGPFGLVDSWIDGIWAIYPLPDGTMISSCETDLPNVGNEVTISHPILINKSLDHLIQLGMSSEDMWLCKIPRRIENLGVFNEELLISKQGEAAIRYPEAAITNLFLINELLLELRLKDHSKFKKTIREEVAKNLGMVFIQFLAEGENKNNDLSNEIAKSLRTFRYSMKRNASYGYYQVWSTTIIQQAFILLNLLGHLANYRTRKFVPIKGDIQKLAPPSLEEQHQADLWAIRRLKKAIEIQFTNKTDWIIGPLRDLFSVFGLINQRYGKDHTNGNCSERWVVLKSYLSKNALNIEQESLKKEKGFIENAEINIIESVEPYRPLFPISLNRRPHESSSDIQYKNLIEQKEKEGYRNALSELRPRINQIDEFLRRKVVENENIVSELIKIGNEIGGIYWKNRGESVNKGSGFDENLEGQIAAYESIMNRIHPDSPLAGLISKSLGHILLELYIRTEKQCFLELSVFRLRKAVSLTRGIQERSDDLRQSLIYLGISLWSRYSDFSSQYIDRFNNPTKIDLVSAIAAFDEALSLTPKDDTSIKFIVDNLKNLARTDQSEGFRIFNNIYSRQPDIILDDQWVSRLSI